MLSYLSPGFVVVFMFCGRLSRSGERKEIVHRYGVVVIWI